MLLAVPGLDEATDRVEATHQEGRRQVAAPACFGIAGHLVPGDGGGSELEPDVMVQAVEALVVEHPRELVLGPARQVQQPLVPQPSVEQEQRARPEP